MVRYTLLRTLVFFGCLLILWLAGLRSRDQLFLLVAGAALISMVVSYFVLRPFREDYGRQIAEKLEHRAEQKAAERGAKPSDEDIEDAETGEGEGSDSFR